MTLPARTRRPVPRLVAPPVVLAVALLAGLVELRTGFGGPRVVQAFDDLAQATAAACATVWSLLRARWSPGPRRRAWRWMAGGTGAWAVGELIWTTYEVVLGRDSPFPSFADAGFLLFPVAGTVSLLLHPR